MTSDPLWNIPLCPLALALAEGRMLEARRILFTQGTSISHAAQRQTQLQDRLAAHLLLCEQGMGTVLLPGSRLEDPLKQQLAEQAADRLTLLLGPTATAKCQRQRF